MMECIWTFYTVKMEITLNNDGMYMDILHREDGTYNVSVPVDKWNCKGFDCKTFDELKVKIQRSFKLYI